MSNKFDFDFNKKLGFIMASYIIFIFGQNFEGYTNYPCSLSWLQFSPNLLKEV